MNRVGLMDCLVRKGFLFKFLENAFLAFRFYFVGRGLGLGLESRRKDGFGESYMNWGQIVPPMNDIHKGHLKWMTSRSVVSSIHCSAL